MTTPTADREFRHDINALRAIAVVSVVLFHFRVPGFSGGFVGVDVFFVISGYLMTRILMERVGQDTAWSTIGRFYLARARRIIPPLLVLVLALCIGGWFVLASYDYGRLGGHAMHAAVFDSNIKFWREAGYFDTASDEKWLLHTWSLSVEWQFYLVLPLVVTLAWRLVPREKVLLALYVLGLALSLAVSIWLARTDQSAGFFLLHSRAWEMLAGGLVWFTERRLNLSTSQRRALVLSGCAAILFSIFYFDDRTTWPGLAATLPVLGCAVTLVARQTSSSWANNPPVHWLGTRSYSMYLWHWPVVVLPIYLGWQHGAALLLASLLSVLLLSDLSYRLIEERSRSWVNRLGDKRGAFALVAAVVLVVGTGRTIRNQLGFPSRLPSDVQAIEQEADNINPNRERCHGRKTNPTPDCILGGTDIAVIMLGDSHASATVTALQAALPQPSMAVLAMSYTSCPTIAGVQMIASGDACSAFNEWAFERMGQVPPSVPLIIANRTSVYLFGKDGEPPESARPLIYFDRPHDLPDARLLAQTRKNMLDTWCALARKRPVYLMQPVPEMPRHVPDALARGLMHGHKITLALDEAEYQARHAWIREVQQQAVTQCGVRLLDPVPWLCERGSCPADTRGRPRYSDSDHLSEFGNRLLVPMFRSIFAGEDPS